MCGNRFLGFTILMLAGMLVLGFASPSPASGHGDKKKEKKGILLVSFGTSVPEAQKVYDNIDAAAKERFKGLEVRWAYTAKMIRRKLAKEGKITLSPSQALAQMAEDGFTHVAIQSLHIIPGQEFHNMRDTVMRFQGMPKGIQKIAVGWPLLATSEDMHRAAEAVLKNIPQERKKDEAVVLMGHGTHHPGNVYYPAMSYLFRKMDPKVMVGTVEGFPEIGDVQKDLAAAKIKKVWLMPFMSVAGDHAQNDMAGGEDDSWKSILTKAGFECRTVLKGLAAYPQVVEIWLDHLDTAVKHIQ